MELRQLRTLDAVARTMSFTKAARELHFAQSTVSEQIQNLERELGTQLFDRSNRRLALTDEGRALSEYAGRIIALSDEAQRAVTRGTLAAPQLSVGALETLSAHRLPTVLARYRTTHPNVRVSLKRGNRGQLYTAVSRSQLHMCLTFGPAPASFGLKSAALSREPLVVITPVGHELSTLSSAPIGRLLAEPFLVTAPGCGFREMYDYMLATLGGVGSRPSPAAEPVLELDSIDALIACVAGGMGCALLPRVAVLDAAQHGHVAVLDIADQNLDVPVTLSWLDNGPTHPHVTAFEAELACEFTAVDNAPESPGRSGTRL